MYWARLWAHSLKIFAEAAVPCQGRCLETLQHAVTMLGAGVAQFSPDEMDGRVACMHAVASACHELAIEASLNRAMVEGVVGILLGICGEVNLLMLHAIDFVNAGMLSHMSRQSCFFVLEACVKTVQRLFRRIMDAYSTLHRDDMPTDDHMACIRCFVECVTHTAAHSLAVNGRQHGPAPGAGANGGAGGVNGADAAHLVDIALYQELLFTMIRDLAQDVACSDVGRRCALAHMVRQLVWPIVIDGLHIDSPAVCCACLSAVQAMLSTRSSCLVSREHLAIVAFFLLRRLKTLAPQPPTADVQRPDNDKLQAH